MDGLTMVRTAMTVVMFVVFVGIALWAYSARRAQRFDTAARSVLEDDDMPGARATAAGRE